MVFLSCLNYVRAAPWFLNHLFWILCFESLHLPISQRIPGLGKTDLFSSCLWTGSSLKFQDEVAGFPHWKETCLVELQGHFSGHWYKFYEKKYRDMGYQRDNGLIIVKSCQSNLNHMLFYFPFFKLAFSLPYKCKPICLRENVEIILSSIFFLGAELFFPHRDLLYTFWIST